MRVYCFTTSAFARSGLGAAYFVETEVILENVAEIWIVFFSQLKSTTKFSGL